MKNLEEEMKGIWEKSSWAVFNFFFLFLSVAREQKEKKEINQRQPQTVTNSLHTHQK